EETIDDIIRIYGTERGSQVIALSAVGLPAKKNLVRMINSQNNERLFFADRVVLVEGIIDRLIVTSLIERLASRLANNDAIEVIEVGGKGNFEQYRRLLDSLKTPSFVVADQDYLADIGSAKTKGLFVADSGKLWDSLTKDKKSLDAKSLVERLKDAIDQ